MGALMVSDATVVVEIVTAPRVSPTGVTATVADVIVSAVARSGDE
jgi:hypothetical protein